MLMKTATNLHHGIAVTSKSTGPAGPLSVKFEGPQAILRPIGPRAHHILILIPVYNNCHNFRLIWANFVLEFWNFREKGAYPYRKFVM